MRFDRFLNNLKNKMSDDYNYDNLEKDLDPNEIECVKNALTDYYDNLDKLDRFDGWDDFCAKKNVNPTDKDIELSTKTFSAVIWHDKENNLFINPEINIFTNETYENGTNVLENFNVNLYEEALELGGKDILADTEYVYVSEDDELEI